MFGLTMAVVTDPERKFVLGLATAQDLEVTRIRHAVSMDLLTLVFSLSSNDVVGDWSRIISPSSRHSTWIRH